MQIASVDLFSFFNLLLGFLMGDCGTRNGCRMLMSQYVSDSQAQTHKPPSCVNQKLQEHMFLSIKQSSERMELSSNLVSNNYFVTTFGNMNMENQKRILKIGHFSWHKTTQMKFDIHLIASKKGGSSPSWPTIGSNVWDVKTWWDYRINVGSTVIR